MKLGSRPSVFSKAERLRILLENAHLLTNAQVCRKWGITLHTLRKWKKEFDYGPWLGGEEVWVTAALYISGRAGATLEQIESFLDFKNHCRYSDEEILSILRKLKGRRLATCERGTWYYAHPPRPPSASFVFGVPTKQTRANVAKGSGAGV